MKFEIRSIPIMKDDDSSVSVFLTSVFVNEGYTNPDLAQRLFSPEELRKRGKLFIAVDSSERGISGTAFLVKPSSPYRQIAKIDEVEIHLLAVSPDARTRGVGRELIHRCIEEAELAGFKRVILSTQPTMHAAHHLYEKMGFVRNQNRDWQRPGGGIYHVYEYVIG